MLKTLYAFLDHSNDISKSFNLWFKAVTSLSWYACARMSEVLGLCGKDFSFAKSTTSQQDPDVRLEYHEYTFHDRKPESGNDRTYRLHYCQELRERDICAKHHFDKSTEHVETAMKHSFDEDLVFPQMFPQMTLLRKYSHLSASVFNCHAMSEGYVIMMLYGRVDAITSVELTVTLCKKVVAALTAGDVEIVACLGDFAPTF
ncbi:hypothetical protein DYB30_006090 [Aphanomyces astaci]|uniref:Uncharacterized protein n=1 Tax=Aphanomyces astaci TaxID=112090 RepID=A0A397CR91_APHAT|nr:hypothetical protein DYB38_007517 [Aphanomyces astaci]RHY76456.1 hypothetical protein DYB30_006090 [Aphanomyces astaci]RHZ09394.1 hypothetical protein DYB31_004858 [Aphanomyces astaci]RHZ21349.1 hypothetical protein DYB26_002787 [Aphanomyces astaci]